VFLLAGLLLWGCAPQGLAAQEATATVTAANVTASPTLAVEQGTPSSPQPGATAEATSAPPTPSGPPPDNPLDLLNIFRFYLPSDTLVRRDLFDLDGTSPEEVLITVSGPGSVITGEVGSTLGVIFYDPVYRRWNGTWQSDFVPGSASPLPPQNANTPLGYNGGFLTGAQDRVFALRTTTPDGRAHLRLWRWDQEKKAGEPLKILDNAGVARDAAFEADLDANVIDLDDDGVFEIALDNVASVEVWKWDQGRSAYVLQEGR
jgi:hypothetical protein